MQSLEVLYVYGLGLGHCYKQLSGWLKQQEKRDLIFIEDDPSSFNAFLQSELATELLEDSQVHLFYRMEEEEWDPFLEELSVTFPVSQMEILALPAYESKKHFADMRLKLLRKTTLSESLFSDRLYSHVPFENFIKNLKQLPDSFFANKLKNAFSNIPAIVCGAGPSLKHSLDTLRSLENRALIFAGGSTLAALSTQGVTPHFGMAVDPNEEEYERLLANKAVETPILYSTRVCPKVFETFNGPKGYMRTGIGGIIELWMEERLGLEEDFISEEVDPEALSVTTICIAFARFLGCNPIILDGVDLAFTDQKRYAEGVIEEEAMDYMQMQKEKRIADRLFMQKDQKEEEVTTNVRWIMESNSISSYAKKFPETLFLNATHGGLGFEGVARKPFSQIIDKYLTKTYDLQGMVHTSIQKAQLGAKTKEQIEELTQTLQTSLASCHHQSTQMINELKTIQGEPFETAMMVLAELDLKEEIAYDCLFYDTLSLLETMMNRNDRRAQTLKHLQEKWKSFHHIVENHLKIAGTH